MQIKLKRLYYYLAELILSLLILILFLAFIAKITLLNPNFLLKLTDKNNYYQEIYNSIETEMTYYVDSSGLDESVVRNIINEDIVKEEVQEFINGLYTNQKYELKTDDFKLKLRNRIDSYLEENNLTGKEEDINSFVNKMTSIYTNKITFGDKINFVSSLLVKAEKLVSTVIIILLVVIIVFYLFSKVICHKYLLSIPLMTSALLIFLGNYLIYHEIDVKNFKFWNESVSKLIKSIVNTISIDTIVGAIIFLVLAIVFIMLKTFRRKKVKN